ncbi:MAG: hypothetical protein U1D25_18880 [Hydrogenophaga sp.]|nr:hypothetical protein [Hydrogenophaga sp.]
MSDFSPQQAKQLSKLLGRPPICSPTGTAESLLLRYVFLESLVRRVGQYFRERNTAQKKSNTEDSSLNVEVVKRSLRYFDILVDERRVDRLLGSPKARRGQRTARELRNGLVHRWDINDANEAVARFDELTGSMAALIEAIASRAKRSTP